MGKRGPQPKSLKQKELEGNPGKRPLTPPPDDVDPALGGIKLPRRLTVAEQEIWRETVASMPDGYFTKVDQPNLIAYARCLNRMEKAERALQNTKMVQTRGNGSLARSPHVQIIEICLKQMLALQGALGISRDKRMVRPVGMPAVPPTDPIGQDGGELSEFGDLLAQPLNGLTV